jgi:hypothetical protein
MLIHRKRAAESRRGLPGQTAFLGHAFCGTTFSFPLGQRSEGAVPLPRKFLIFKYGNGAFWWILVSFVVCAYDHCKISGCSRPGRLTITGPWYAEPPDPLSAAGIEIGRGQIYNSHRNARSNLLLNIYHFTETFGITIVTVNLQHLKCQ